MKTVLCYGDSNTFGYIPETGMRYSVDVRWTGSLQKLLGEEYRVIEEGCNGRTTIYDDPIDGWKNGVTYLRPCLNSHKPIDIVILMLGSNDMKVTFNASAEDAANGAGQIVDIIKEFTSIKQGFVPQIILVAPPVISKDVLTGPFVGAFDERSVSESEKFADCYKSIASKKECIYFDAGSQIKPSYVDGLHLSKESHKKLSLALYEVIKGI